MCDNSWQQFPKQQEFRQQQFGQRAPGQRQNLRQASPQNHFFGRPPFPGPPSNNHDFRNNQQDHSNSSYRGQFDNQQLGSATQQTFQQDPNNHERFNDQQFHGSTRQGPGFNPRPPFPENSTDNQNFNKLQHSYDSSNLQHQVHAVPPANNFRMPPPNFNQNFNSNRPPFMPNIQNMKMDQSNSGASDVPSSRREQMVAGVGDILGQMKRATVDQEQRNDNMWLDKWLKKRKSQYRAQKDGKGLKISEVQEKTRQMIVLLARLQKNKKHLESMKQEDKSVWEQKLKEVTQIKSQLEVLQRDLTSPESLLKIQRKINDRRKKRERLRQKKQCLYHEEQAALAQRELKHSDIDKHMQKLAEKQRMVKQEADMQKEGDDILCQVRKKLTDAGKTIELLNGVQKLRKLRRDRLERQGVLGMCESGDTKEKFDTSIHGMVDMLNTQLHTYRAEEEALEVILKTEHDETREKEKERLLQKQIERQINQLKKEEEMLFGNSKEARPGDPLYPFRQYYNMASSNLETLVSVRQEWDMYLTMPNTQGASTLPQGWVIPPEPSSEHWASAMVNK